MSELSIIDINNVNYGFKDTAARSLYQTLNGAIEQEQATRIANCVVGGNYNSQQKTIELLNANDEVVGTIDATLFVKDGMVSNVAVVNGYLVITFNTDSGKSPISIPLTSIFNPSNYYQKSEIDSKLTEKQSEISDLESKIGYYECSSGASSVSKTVTASNYVLGNGGSIKIKMQYANTANNATLNINSTGAKPLFYDGARASSTNTWEAGEVLDVYYDGTNFQANNSAGGGKFATGQKVKETGIETVPTAGSVKLVQSGGVNSFVAEESSFGKKNLILYSDFGGVTKVKYILNTDGTVESKTTNSYVCYIQTKPINKGAVLNITGTTNRSARFSVGITTTPITENNFAGITYDIFYNKTLDGDVNDSVVVPYDGYIIYYRYIDYWSVTQGVKVFNSSRIQDNSVLDVSELNDTNYASLGDTLSAIPAALQKGGMAIRYRQIILATYNVAVSESDTEPTGTALGSASSVSDGIYIASQLADFSTLPSEIGVANAEIYYYENNSTYTVWTITMYTAESSEYVQYRLMKDIWSAAVSDWQGIDSTPIYGSKNAIESGAVERGLYMANHPYCEPEVIQTGADFNDYGTSSATAGAVSIVKNADNSFFYRKSSSSSGSVYIGLFNYDYTIKHYLYLDYILTKDTAFNVMVRTGKGTSDTSAGGIGITKGSGSIRIPLNKTVQGKYIVIANTTLDTGSTLTLSNIRLVKEDDTEIMSVINEMGSVINTSIENSYPITIGDEYQYLTPDYWFADSNVSNGVIVDNSSLSHLRVKQITKGDVIHIHAEQTGSASDSGVVLYYSSVKPVIGTTDIRTIARKNIGNNNPVVDIYWIADADGWIIVRSFLRDIIKFSMYKKVMYDALESFLSENIYPSVTTGRAIISDPDAANYGEVISTGSASFGVTDFIDISGAVYVGFLDRVIATNWAEGSITGHVFYNVNKEPIQTISNIEGESPGASSSKWGYYPVPSNAVYARFTLYNGGRLSLLKQSLDNVSNSDIYKERIAQAKYVNSAPTIQSLGLVHFSDIHGDQISADAISKFIAQHSDYITDVLCTGDSVHYYADATSGYPQGSVWWKETSNLADKSLFVLGNHDSATPASTEYDQKEDSAAWDGKGKDWCFTTYIEPYIETLGYIMPDGYDDSTSPNYHACYWHKDYAAQKIRIIGLDCLHRFDGILNPATGEITTAGVKWTTNEQELWLIEKLNETLDSTNEAYGYSVIVACHYPIDNFSGNNEEWDDTTHKFVYNQNAAGGRVMDFKTGDVVGFHYGNTTSYSATGKFNMNNRVDNGYSQGEPYPNYTQGSTNNVANIIKTWMDNGGTFVAWLCGHTHVDYMWYSTKYPNILCVVLDQAGCLRGTNTGDRSTNLDSRVCANYYSIDTQNGLFKIVRIGYTMNRLMNSHEYLCYDYINRKVLNEG